MKKLFALLLLCSSTCLAQGDLNLEGYAAKGLYSVEFTTSIGGCLKETKPETFTLNFGERDKSGHCVDNSKLLCTTRYTSSLMKNGLALSSDGPIICEKGMRGRCSEVQFKFDLTTDTKEDAVSFQVHDVRNGKLFTPEARLVKVADILEQTKRYVVSMGACEYTLILFKVSKR